jgi:L-serine deaminase
MRTFEDDNKSEGIVDLSLTIINAAFARIFRILSRITSIIRRQIMIGNIRPKIVARLVKKECISSYFRYCFAAVNAARAKLTIVGLVRLFSDSTLREMRL